MERTNFWLASLLVAGSLALVSGCAADTTEDGVDADGELADEEASAEQNLTAIAECEFKYKDGTVQDYYPKGGGYAVFNVTTRGVTCGTANGMAKSYYNQTLSKGAFDKKGFTCTESVTHPYGPQTDALVDTRCTKGEQVVRFQTSA